MLPAEEQLSIIDNKTVDIEVKAELLLKLKKQVPLIVKAGFDPTAPDLHLGHVVVLNKLKQFQDLGHQIVIVIGDFTAGIGDPTGRSVTRPPLSSEQIATNSATYKAQLGKILDLSKTIIRFNSEWLDGKSMGDALRIASHYSVARILEREDFRLRLKTMRPLAMHELFYPLCQGYDSVALKADIEIGGTDQRFNLFVGRDLMRAYDLEPQCILTMPLLEGIDAQAESGILRGNKMSKSLNNYVGVTDEPQEQYGKIMSICDLLMWKYYNLLTNFELTDEFTSQHPKKSKETLAHMIVTRFHGIDAANKAVAEFDRLFSKRKDVLPDNYTSFYARPNDSLLRIIVGLHFASTNSEARRLISQGACHMNGEKIELPDRTFVSGEYVLRSGKRNWAKVIVE